MTEHQVIAVLLAVNTADSATGEVALAQGLSEAMKTYGRDMVQQHMAMNIKLDELRQREGVEAATALSRELATMGGAEASRLRSLSPVEVETMYRVHAIAAHEHALKLINERLMKSVRRGEVRNLIIEQRDMIVQHLERAQALPSGAQVGH